MNVTTQHQCKTCVLIESQVIHIETDGNCNVCHNKDLYKHIVRQPDHEKLNNLIEQIKKNGKSSEYDCIVGWSGGRDSTSLIYELVKTHKLRCLAMFFKTPFTPVEIVENVHSIAKKLGIKLIERDTPKKHLEIASYCINLYIKNRLSILINLACAPCKYVNREILKQANNLNIKAVIYGGNRYEYIPSSPAAIEIKSENRYSYKTMIRDNALRISKGFKLIVTSPRLLKYIFTFFQASVLYVNFYTIYLRLLYPKIVRMDYYFFADWNEKRINTILNEMDWKLPKGCNSTWRADCTFEAVKNTVFKKNLGFTCAHAMYSNLIRAGKITREEAIQRLEKESISEQRLDEALDLCKVSKGSFLN